MKHVQSAAIVTIKDAPNMSKRGRKAVVKWLREQAHWLEQYGDQLGKRFTARYLYK